MFNRIFLFLATNMAIIFVLNISMRLLGFDTYMAATGQDTTGLLVFAAIIGMSGSFISLAMSKSMARRSTGAQVIEQPANEGQRWLLQTVTKQAEQAGIGMPEVAIYESPDVNAFATGMNKNNALVAVSTGLLKNMSRNEAEAVLAHEVTHVANGDMVTLALIQGVVNTFVVFFARIIGRMVDSALSGGRDGGRVGIGYWVTTIVAEIVLGILASTIVFWFSRRREFKADFGGGQLAGNANMVAALERLQSMHAPADLPEQMAAFGISHGPGKFGKLFASHPPLEERIAALRAQG
ncbi:MAG: protease HtpX [Proteobacteria bacterium]|nr:protease HtpX [Pseudomonadota bacterium]